MTKSPSDILPSAHQPAIPLTHAGIPCDDDITPWMSVRLGPWRCIGCLAMRVIHKTRVFVHTRLIYVSAYVKIVGVTWVNVLTVTILSVTILGRRYSLLIRIYSSRWLHLLWTATLEEPVNLSLVAFICESSGKFQNFSCYLMLAFSKWLQWDTDTNSRITLPPDTSSQSILRTTSRYSIHALHACERRCLLDIRCFVLKSGMFVI